MTNSRFDMVDEQQQRDKAQRLADTSTVLDFETALKIVRHRPAEAEELLRLRDKIAERQAVRARLREERRLALIEDFG